MEWSAVQGANVSNRDSELKTQKSECSGELSAALGTVYLARVYCAKVHSTYSSTFVVKMTLGVVWLSYYRPTLHTEYKFFGTE